MELSPGTMVNANVRLTRPLGQGAMGEVWVAQHLTLHTEVAVKFITPELGSRHQEVLSRFEQEASMAAQIKSPHVVQTFDQGKMEDGTPFIVMELLEGESLQELLDRVQRVEPVVAVQVVNQVARALSRAHKLGIVHRDIKPDNIFIATHEDGIHCKVLDFGIAKQTRLPKMGGLTHAGIMIGTPEYMSPEQVMSAKDVDHHADIWALAATTYQMLTGFLAFEGEAIGDLCVKLLEGRYDPPSEVSPDLPKELDAFFSKAFSSKKTARFETAREMARALHQVFPDVTAETLLDTLESMPPPSSVSVPKSKASTLPGVVERGSLDEDAEERIETVRRQHRAATATLNGSTASQPIPSEVIPRKRTNVAALVMAAAVFLGLGGVIAFVAFNPGSRPTEGGTGAHAAPIDPPLGGIGDGTDTTDGSDDEPTAEPGASAEPASDDDTPPAAAAGSGSAAAAAGSASTGASSVRSPVKSPRPSTLRAAPEPTSSSGHKDHGF